MLNAQLTKSASFQCTDINQSSCLRRSRVSHCFQKEVLPILNKTSYLRIELPLEAKSVFFQRYIVGCLEPFLPLWESMYTAFTDGSMVSTWGKNIEILSEVCKCTLKKRTFICVTSFEKYAIGSYLLIFVIDSICMIFVEVMSAP